MGMALSSREATGGPSAPRPEGQDTLRKGGAESSRPKLSGADYDNASGVAFGDGGLVKGRFICAVMGGSSISTWIEELSKGHLPRTGPKHLPRSKPHTPDPNTLP